ncbi:MAG: hypothetical protein NVS4B3_04930 [Gemmatimonadaceae bacterium]
MRPDEDVELLCECPLGKVEGQVASRLLTFGDDVVVREHDPASPQQAATDCGEPAQYEGVLDEFFGSPTHVHAPSRARCS